MIDHVAIKVSDIEKSRKFYEKAFAPLGFKVAFDAGGFCAFDVGKGFLSYGNTKAVTPLPLSMLHS